MARSRGKTWGNGLRRVRARLKLVHLSDTPLDVFRHAPVGTGVVPFAAVPPLLEEVGYSGPPMLEIICERPDSEIPASIEALETMGESATLSCGRAAHFSALRWRSSRPGAPVTVTHDIRRRPTWRLRFSMLSLPTAIAIPPATGSAVAAGRAADLH